jgi:hypothetical protein
MKKKKEHHSTKRTRASCIPESGGFAAAPGFVFVWKQRRLFSTAMEEVPVSLIS